VGFIYIGDNSSDNMVLKSKISDDYRTTVPKGVREYLGLDIGDLVYWNMGNDGEDDSRIAVMSKVLNIETNNRKRRE
jgi:bifunctional DNA-binding transcriptional regulator/antitoxin component of YhaV-PrlF toxin-antitoxin module